MALKIGQKFNVVIKDLCYSNIAHMGQALFSSYDPISSTNVTTSIGTLKVIHVNTPAGGWVFELRPRKQRQSHQQHQYSQCYTYEHPCRRLSFQVTTP